MTVAVPDTDCKNLHVIHFKSSRVRSRRKSAASLVSGKLLCLTLRTYFQDPHSDPYEGSLIGGMRKASSVPEADMLGSEVCVSSTAREHGSLQLS